MGEGFRPEIPDEVRRASESEDLPLKGDPKGFVEVDSLDAKPYMEDGDIDEALDELEKAA